MKSLCISAPFLKTESGITTLGLPVEEIVTGAILLKVLSSARRILSTRVGCGGFETVVEGSVDGVWFEREGRKGFWIGFSAVIMGGRLGYCETVWIEIPAPSMGALMVIEGFSDMVGETLFGGVVCRLWIRFFSNSLGGTVFVVDSFRGPVDVEESALTVKEAELIVVEEAEEFSAPVTVLRTVVLDLESVETSARKGKFCGASGDAGSGGSGGFRGRSGDSPAVADDGLLPER